MRKMCLVFLVAFTCLLLSCGQMGDVGDIVTKSYELVDTDATTKKSIGGSSIIVDACEVTYIKWYDLKKEKTDYTFINDGREGGDGIDGASPSRYDNPSHIILGKRPVTAISYADVIVWLNAYSIKNGKSPCYKKNDAEIKNANNIDNFNDIILDDAATGYRLLTEAEYNALISGVTASSVLANNGESDFFPAETGKKESFNGLYDIVGNAAEFIEYSSGEKCKAVGLASTTGNITNGKTVELGIKEISNVVSFRAVCKAGS